MTTKRIHFFRRGLAAAGLFVLWFLPLSTGASGLKNDEQVVLYPALGRAVSGGWELQLHGIVYEPESHPLLAKFMRRALGIDDDKLSATEKRIFKQRSSYFLVDNERGKEFSVSLLGRTVPLGTSGANGHFEALAVFVSGEFQTGRAGAGLVLPVGIATQGGGKRELSLQVDLLPEEGLSVISDIDDTIKISEVRKRHEVVMNTFCRPFQPVPGMAGVYRQWALDGARFHYVTASPWQLYLPLSEFTRSNGFPAGTFHMKSVRVKDTSFFNLFESPERYKTPVMEELLRQYPKRQWVCVGDSGEKDPEIYGALRRKYPRQIQQIFIRDVTEEAPGSARYREAFRDIPEGSWQVFEKPEEIKWTARPSPARIQR